jgi:tetratricopeptide (TPR) repeat protein
MRVELITPLEKPAKIRVTYNDTELFTNEFAAGDTPKLAFETPQESGRAKAYLLVDGEEERLVGLATYYFDDLVGAQMLCNDATALARKKKQWAARTRLLKAIALFEKLTPDSDEMARAYLSMSMVYFFAHSRKHKVAQRQHEALAWYEKAIAVYERNGDIGSLGGNLSNVSEMYRRVGDFQTALDRATRALELERAHPTAADDETYGERVGAWTHAAGAYLTLGRLDEAEAVVYDGLERLGADPSTGYLWQVLGSIHDERAKWCRQRVLELLPQHTCAL